MRLPSETPFFGVPASVTRNARCNKLRELLTKAVFYNKKNQTICEE